MSVCPVCNGLTVEGKDCPLCGRPMFDAGLLQNYYDNYSAYLEQELYEDGYRNNDNNHCIHLFTCRNCHFDTYLKFRKQDNGYPSGSN